MYGHTNTDYDFSFQGKVSGQINVRESVVKQTHTFLDFIMGSTKLNCTIAIDFTGKKRHWIIRIHI
jgi:hypothetical protein